MDLPLSVLSQVAAILDQQGIRYVLVGSFASSIHGMYRATADIDILADINTEQVRPLFESLRNEFYVDEKTMRDAVAHRRSFNVIHFNSVFKVDFFVAKSDEFAAAQLDRRELRPILPNREETVYVASAEDTILAKLRWYRLSNDSLINQWKDVLGVLGISKNSLNLPYLRTWAEKLGVADLLKKALDDTKEESEE